jgi:hypothetical protein
VLLQPNSVLYNGFLTDVSRESINISEPVNIRYLLEIQDRNIFKASVNQKRAIVDLIPRKKSTSYSLRTEFSQYPRVNTERFKLSFANRLIFNYNLFI